MESDGGSTKRGVEFDDDQVNGGGNVMKRRGVVFAKLDIDGGEMMKDVRGHGYALSYDNWALG